MQKPVVIFSSDSNPDYSEFAPLVSEMWRELNFEPFYAKVGSDQFPLIEGVSSSLQAQIVRLYATKLFLDRVTLITDIDMLPFDQNYFWSKLPTEYDQISIYSADAYGGSRYPMCYLSAYGKTFSSIVLDHKDETWEEFVRRLNALNLGWNTDELYVTKRIDSSNVEKIKYNREWINGLAKKRLDRAQWRIGEDSYIDAHCPRPYSKYKDSIDSLKRFIVKDFLSGYNFARQSDVVFAENIPTKESHKIYIADYFELDDKNIIYCKTDFVEKLFDILNDEKDIKNINLITHESDREIDKNLFYKKPSCISKWYAQNVNYDHPDLIPIPIGLANDYCKITLKYNDLKKTGSPTKLLYINHRSDTYPKDRKWMYDYFETNDWCTVDQPNLTLNHYKKQLDNHYFILCPRGNGIDTHRVWESLYHGIIPIVEKHIHYDGCLSGLPSIIVDSFKDVTKEFLQQKLIEFKCKKFDTDKLNVAWWIEKIRKGETL